MRDIEPNTNESDDDMQNILQGISTRPEPSAEATDKAYAILKNDWQEQVGKRRANMRVRRLLQTAAAISVLGISMLVTDYVVTVDEWHAELVAGEVSYGSAKYSAPDRLVLDGKSMMTALTAARIELDNGAELRLAAHTDTEWLDGQQIYLKRGSAYVDTHDRANVVIKTDLGEVRDIGTRFMVSVGAESEERVEVAVREGIAQVTVDSATYEAAAVDQTAALISIDRSGVRSSTETTSDPRWAWIHDISAGYRAGTVPELLSLIGRDLGKRVVYANRGVEATVATVEVQGDLTHVSPRRALTLVAQSAGLKWREEDTQITVNFNQ